MIVPHGCKAAVCESFVPCGKITKGKHYSIITDHLGTPIEVYNQEGELIWEREQDLYGNSRQGFAKENFRCPFKYQGQYYDSEVELCYNRFRYYHPETGRYISEDPIGFLSGEPNFLLMLVIRMRGWICWDWNLYSLIQMTLIIHSEQYLK